MIMIELVKVSNYVLSEGDGYDDDDKGINIETLFMVSQVVKLWSVICMCGNSLESHTSS